MDAIPNEIRQELVMSAAAIDGQVVTTHRLHGPMPPDAVADALRAHWKARGRVVIESRRGEWTILSARDPAGLVAVQLRPDGQGTEGLSSRWHRPDAAAAARDAAEGPERWMPEGARVVRRIVHRDAGRDAATLIAWTPDDPARSSRLLRDRAARDGFVDDPALGLPAGRAAWYRGIEGTGQAIALRRADEELVATVSPHRDGTAIVIHWGAAR